ncbi:MAG: acetyl-CoA acetyltransferase [Deltaproteobacteria bacterium]|nr:acetyl-CoA acetyltransferase [Deltaproteobacteria bacterium]
MSAARETPVLVGVGQILQRLEDPRQAAEPLELMTSALAQAGEDSGAPKLLQQAESIYVLRGAWGYGDPGREIARRLGAAPIETVGTPYGGNFAQSCLIDAARRIQTGERGVVLIVGGENGRTQGQARRQGVELSASQAPGAPDRILGEDKPLFHDAELARGMNSASDIFAIIESAIRFARGESLADHVERISTLWASFNAVARDNPSAWIRKPYSAQEIGRAGPDNPMISYPYTRLMNANARVDMAAGLLLCSQGTARNAGVPDAKLVFPHAATEANDTNYASTRADLHRSPAMRIAGARALELAGKTIAEIDHVDLYSCFPSAVQVAATELGVPEGRPLTVTGGLTFGGGPLNSYVLHSIARMAEVVREDRGATGLISANGGWLAKHAFAIYSSEPPSEGFRYENPQALVDVSPLREAVVDWEGPVSVEAYTVAHRVGKAHQAKVACLTDDGRRTWAIAIDPAVMEAMTREEFCGRRGRIDGAGNLSVD